KRHLRRLPLLIAPAQSSQIGQVLQHGRYGHATRLSWHGCLARAWRGATRLLAICNEPPFPPAIGHFKSDVAIVRSLITASLWQNTACTVDFRKLPFVEPAG